MTKIITYKTLNGLHLAHVINKSQNEHRIIFVDSITHPIPGQKDDYPIEGKWFPLSTAAELYLNENLIFSARPETGLMHSYSCSKF